MNIHLWQILLLGSLTALLIIPYFLQSLLITVTVWGNSMYPLLTHGDRVLILRHYPAKLFKLDQVVVGFLSPHHIGSPSGELSSVEALFIKKIAGLPGEEVTIPSSKLHKYMRDNASVKCNDEGDFVWHVPEDHCFVRGEAPINGDSVTWGPVPLDTLVSIVLFKWASQADLTTAPPPIPGYPSFQRPAQAEEQIKSEHN